MPLKMSRTAIGQWTDATRAVLRRGFVRQVGALTLANVIGAMFGAVQAILVARWLGPELLGIAAIAMGYPGFVHSLLDVKAKEVCIKYLGECHARDEGVRAATMCRLGYFVDGGIALLALALVWVSSTWVSQHMMHRPDLVWLLVLQAASLAPRAFIGTSHAVLITLGRFRMVAVLEALNGIVRSTVSVALVWLGWSVAGIVWANVMSSLVVGAGYAFIAHRLIVREWGIAWPRASWSVLNGDIRQITRFLLYTDVSLLITAVSRQIDVLLIGYFRGPTETGLYRIARSLSDAVGHVSGPLSTVTYVRMSRLWGLKDLDEMQRQASRLHRKVGLPLGVAVATSALLIPWVLPVLVGPAYAAAVPAAEILLVSTALGCVFFWVRPSYMAADAVGRLVTISSVGSIVFLVALLAGVRSLGHIGAAAAVLVREVLEVSWAAAVLVRRGPPLASARSSGADRGLES